MEEYNLNEKGNYMGKKYSSTDKILFRIILCMTSLSLFSSMSWADTVKIKDGGKIDGIIQQESDGKIIVEIKFGKITLVEGDIESIKRDSEEENDLLRQKWERERQKTEKSREYTDKKAVEIKQEKVKPKTSTAGPDQKRPSKETQTITQKPKSGAGAIFIVRCDDNRHSYAACLPPDYEKRRKCPVIFCFDPGGDGTTAVRKFSFVAEKYGWIVVGSLNAKNGPWDPILKAQSAMLNDIKKRYNTDQKNYYAAGFSGGARMSYTIAYRNPSDFKGVIASGAGFGQGQISKKVAVYHCVGKTDSNIDEVKRAHAKLQSEGVTSRLNVFAGGHSYPPDNVIKEAVDWIASR